MTQNLTALEVSALNALVAEGLGCMGGSKALDLLDDNMGCMFPAELAKALKINLQAVGGVMSSLQQKGLTSWDEISDGKDGYWLTEAGIRVVAFMEADAALAAPAPALAAPADLPLFVVTVRNDARTLDYTAAVHAADKKAAIRLARDAAKLAGISRKLGTLRFSAAKA